MSEIRYGSKVSIRDKTSLDGYNGVVIKILPSSDIAEVLLDKEIIWLVKIDKLELVS